MRHFASMLCCNRCGLTGDSESLPNYVAGTLLLLYAQPRVLRLGYCRRSAGRGRPQTAGQVAIEQTSADIAIVEEVRVESITEVLGQQRRDW